MTKSGYGAMRMPVSHSGCPSEGGVTWKETLCFLKTQRIVMFVDVEKREKKGKTGSSRCLMDSTSHGPDPSPASLHKRLSASPHYARGCFRRLKADCGWRARWRAADGTRTWIPAPSIAGESAATSGRSNRDRGLKC